MTSRVAAAVPGPGFVAGTHVSTWLDMTPAGPVAWLLIGHGGPRRPGETAEKVEAGLMGMADSMRLRPVTDRVPHVGRRLLVRGRIAALDYGHPEYLLRVPHPGERWCEHVVHGGNACLSVGLDPLPGGEGEARVEEYLHGAALRGRLRVGATGVRGR